MSNPPYVPEGGGGGGGGGGLQLPCIDKCIIDARARKMSEKKAREKLLYQNVMKYIVERSYRERRLKKTGRGRYGGKREICDLLYTVPYIYICE